MAKRGENIYHRRDGRWEGRYIKGRRPDGKPMFGSIYGHSYGEVKKRLVSLKMACAEKSVNIRNNRPFQEFLLAHLALKRESGIKASSYNNYYHIVHNRILPALGGIQMNRLTEQHVRQFLYDLQRKGLSGGTILNIFCFLSGATRAAAKAGILAKDICADITPPKTQPKKVHALSVAEQQRLEHAARETLRKNGSGHGLAVLIALYTGMRLGEICALCWSDIDFDNEVIHVTRTLQRLTWHGADAKTAVVASTPKSASSVRDIPMSMQLSTPLRQWKAQAQGDYVITAREGFAEPRVVQYRFERLLQQAQLPHVGFHALRHSFATRCMELNVDVATISKLLGHSSVKLTLDIYTDSLFEHRRAAMQKLDVFALAA